MRNRGVVISASLLVVVMLAGRAVADVVTYDSEDAFLAAVDDPRLESFEDATATNDPSLTSLDLADFSLSAGETTWGFGVYDRLSENGTHATDGDQHVNWHAQSDEKITFSFDEPVSSFGLTVTDFGDGGEGYTATLVVETSEGSFEALVAPLGDGAVYFVGFTTDEPVLSVSLVNSKSSWWDAIGIDEVYYTPRRRISVEIDIKPGSSPNSINLGSNGTVPVAILSTDGFDATDVDPATITLAGASVEIKQNGKLHVSVEDVDGDGVDDLLVHVVTSEMDLAEDATSAALTGELYDGTEITGADGVRIVP